MSEDETPWMNVEETAKRLDVSERHLRRLTKDEQLPHGRVGTRLIFHKDEVDRWAKEKGR